MKRRTYLAGGVGGGAAALFATVRLGDVGANVLPSGLTGNPGPPGESTYEGVDAPALPGRDDETRWFHEAGEETAVYLEPNDETITPPGRIEFDFVNRSSESAEGNPFYWRVYKLADRKWYPIYPGGWDQPISEVPPDSVDQTTLRCVHGEPEPGREGRTVGRLGGGRYAYAVDYSLQSETIAAIFDIVAPPVTVTVADDASVSDEGDRRVVTLPEYADATEPAVATISRAPAAAERVLGEQLLNGQVSVFRNALPLFESGVERVEVRTDERTVRRDVGREEDTTRRVSYDGQAYEATVEFE